MEGRACFDSSGAYRYRLWREWDAALPCVVFVMLNPSTADGEGDDPTVRRCIGFARSWGFGRLEVVNLCAYRATTPSDLFGADDPVGRDNGAHLKTAVDGASLIVVAWGNNARNLATPRFDGAHHIGLTKLGQPRHPLYVSGCTRPTQWLPGTCQPLAEKLVD